MRVRCDRRGPRTIHAESGSPLPPVAGPPSPSPKCVRVGERRRHRWRTMVPFEGGFVTGGAVSGQRVLMAKPFSARVYGISCWCVVELAHPLHEIFGIRRSGAAPTRRAGRTSHLKPHAPWPAGSQSAAPRPVSARDPPPARPEPSGDGAAGSCLCTPAVRPGLRLTTAGPGRYRSPVSLRPCLVSHATSRTMTISGVLAPIPTPFTDDEAVDLDAWRANIDRWMDTPLHGLVVLGVDRRSAARRRRRGRSADSRGARGACPAAAC